MEERTAWSRNVGTPLREFLGTETGSAVVLLAATIVALIWVNVDAASYVDLWSTQLSIQIGSAGISQDLQHWVNNGLMTFFFFVVGLEARREFDLGELRERRRFALPLLAGLGGMVVPIAIYLAINAGHASRHGWGTAMSTDTAFALGLLVLVGPRFSGRLRAFMLTVSVVDDVVALLVIATVYTTSVVFGPLAAAAVLLVVVLVVRYLGVRQGIVYLPLGKTREYVEIVRTALRRDVVEHEGEHYRIPYDGPGATGLGKPLKMMLRPLRADIPIYLAAIGPKNVALAAEIADGWLPIFVDPERFGDAFGPSLADAPEGFEIAATVNVLVGDDVQALRDFLKPYLALYVGGMGAKGKNFYNALMRRYGWEAEAGRIQELYLGGHQREAIAAVPDELVDAVALVGPKERIRDRLEAWRETPVTTLVVGSPQPEALQVLAELVL